MESSVPTKPMDLADPKAAVFTAAQLDLLGYGSLAKRLVHDSAADRSTPPSMELQNRAFKYWSNVAWTQPAKRGKLLSLLTRFPSLDGIALTKGQQLFLSDLRLTMTPDKPTTQVDRDLDGLLFARDELTSNCWIPLVDPDPIQKKLWLEGFDAVPDLIRHVDDRRLTTMLNGSDAIEPLWMDSHCVTLGAQATMFLDLLSGQFFNTRTQAEAWWNGVKDNSEKAYLERQLANVKSDESLSVNAKYWAAIYEAKFDRRSPEVIEIKSVGLR